MGESLAFILNRFFYSICSGCIINFYFLGTFFVLEKTKLLPDWLKYFKDINFNDSVSAFIFIFFAIIIGIFIDGITDIGIYCFDEREKIFYEQNLVNNQGQNENDDGFEKSKLLGKILFFCFKKATLSQACINYWKQQKKGKEISQYNIFSFMCDPKTKIPYNNKDEVVSTMFIYARLLPKIFKDKNLLKYNDLSFMAQIMSFSFLLIAIFSFCATIYVGISYITNMCDNKLCLALFYLGSLFVSVMLKLLSTSVACSFSKSYVYEVGRWYHAFVFKKNIKMESW